MCLNSSVFSNDFCNDFQRNGAKISYAFKIKMDIKIVINGHYWTLDYKTENKVLNEHEVQLTDTQRKGCPLFTNDYSMAVFVMNEGANKTKDWFNGYPVLFKVTNYHLIRH